MRGRRPLDPVDQLLLRQASDPRRRSTITLVIQLDRVPDWDVLVGRVGRAARLEPRLRQRIVRPWRDIGPPEWVLDRDIDVRAHLVRATLPAPGATAQFLEFVEGDLDHDLDLARPPWQLTLLDGAADGGAALVARMSHVLTDGLAGMQLLAGLVDVGGQPVTSQEQDRTDADADAGQHGDGPADSAAALSPGWLAAENVLRAPGRAQLQYWRNYATAMRTTVGVAVHPLRRFASAAHYARSLVRMAAPTSTPPALAERGAVRRLLLLDVPAGDLRRAARSAGGTLNDGYLAAVMGGLRRYHEGRGERPDEVPFAIPISTRSRDAARGARAGQGGQGGSDEAGNRFAGVRFPAPIGIVDPARRIRRVHEIVSSARAEPALDAMTTLAPALVQLPDLVLDLAGRAQDRLDMLASYVPGPPLHVRLAGAEVVSMFAFGPLPGPAAMSVLLTYAGAARIGFTVDAAAVADIEAFHQAMVDGFAEVLALGDASGVAGA